MRTRKTVERIEYKAVKNVFDPDEAMRRQFFIAEQLFFKEDLDPLEFKVLLFSVICNMMDFKMYTRMARMLNICDVSLKRALKSLDEKQYVIKNYLGVKVCVHANCWYVSEKQCRRDGVFVSVPPELFLLPITPAAFKYLLWLIIHPDDHMKFTMQDVLDDLHLSFSTTYANLSIMWKKNLIKKVEKKIYLDNGSVLTEDVFGPNLTGICEALPKEVFDPDSYEFKTLSRIYMRSRDQILNDNPVFHYRMSHLRRPISCAKKIKKEEFIEYLVDCMEEHSFFQPGKKTIKKLTMRNRRQKWAEKVLREIKLEERAANPFYRVRKRHRTIPLRLRTKYKIRNVPRQKEYEISETEIMGRTFDKYPRPMHEISSFEQPLTGRKPDPYKIFLRRITWHPYPCPEGDCSRFDASFHANHIMYSFDPGRQVLSWNRDTLFNGDDKLMFRLYFAKDIFTACRDPLTLIMKEVCLGTRNGDK